MFDALTPKPADPLLAIIGMFAADQRSHKIDLGVGVYRDMDGVTPVMGTVKVAEHSCWNSRPANHILVWPAMLALSIVWGNWHSIAMRTGSHDPLACRLQAGQAHCVWVLS